MPEVWPSSLGAARARLSAVQPAAYARSRNHLDGAVSRLSPYITHGLLSLPEVLGAVLDRHDLPLPHRWVQELGWRAFFHHVWQHRGEGILRSLHEGPLPDAAYTHELPEDVREGRTGVPVVDQAVSALYATGYLHNHARIWLASYLVHLRKIHWRAGADWLYGHLLDGDLASNHLSWQWVAGTGSHKPYLFNNENVQRFAPAPWHSPGSVVDTSYEALDDLARQPAARARLGNTRQVIAQLSEPPLTGQPPDGWGVTAPDPAMVQGRDVWLVHPWNLGEPPSDLAPNTLQLGIVVADFHHAFPWSPARWQFVCTRLVEASEACWLGDATRIGAALASARSVRSVADPHLAAHLPRWAQCQPAAVLFPPVEPRCDSFSRWWTRSTRGLHQAADLLEQPFRSAA